MINTLKPLIKQFMPFAQQRMGFNKPPRLFLRQDEDNAKNPLGKTAYYDPNQMSVTLYISGRHPKDIMRSLSHELVHHTQNCNGMFNEVGEMGEGYAQNDEHLREMEREAYEQGNLCFRDWEDGIKHTIYFEHLQKGAKTKMSIKKWKNNELKGLLTEQWGFQMDLGKLNEAKGEKGDANPLGGQREEFDADLDGAPDGGDADKNDPDVQEEGAFSPNHYCVHHGGVSRNGSIEMAEAVNHNYNKGLGKVTHYDMKFSDGTIMENVAFEDIQITDASLAEGHDHAMKRDDDKEDDSQNAPLEEMDYGAGMALSDTDECKHLRKDKDKYNKCLEDEAARYPRDALQEMGCGDHADMGGEIEVVDDMAVAEDPESLINTIKGLLSQLEGSMGAAPMEEPMMEGGDDEELEERRARGRDREGMAPDARRRPMQETVVRQRIRKILKNVKFKK